MPCLAATILSGGSRAAGLIEDAVRSVLDICDLVCLGDTGEGAPAAIEVARRVAGERIRVVPIDLVGGGTAFARNAMLDFAASCGADWGLVLDTDERILPNGFDVRAWCERAGAVTCGAVRHASNVYEKEKLVKLPSTGKWVGRAHEYWDWRTTPRCTLPTIRFTEVCRTPEEECEKARLVCAAMAAQYAEEPCTRWAYYWGDALAILGEHEAAVERWQVAESHPGAGEERAWTCMRMAVSLLERLDRPVEAANACLRGLGYCPMVSELAWYRGLCLLKLGRPIDAIYWARMALACGDQRHSPRILFRLPKGYGVGPLEVLREAYARIGDAGASARADAVLRGEITAGLGGGL